jgi:hypothetical protein
MGSGGIASLFLTTALVGGEWSASATLPPEKEPRYPLDKWLGGLQNRTRRCGEEKNLASTGTETPTPRRPARSQSLYRPFVNGGIVLCICCWDRV